MSLDETNFKGSFAQEGFKQTSLLMPDAIPDGTVKNELSSIINVNGNNSALT